MIVGDGDNCRPVLEKEMKEEEMEDEEDK